MGIKKTLYILHWYKCVGTCW